MPAYDYLCKNPTCQRRFEVVKSIKDYNRAEPCPSCDGRETIKQLSAPRVVTDFPGYSCPITGDWVEGKKAHRENLAKHGCRIQEPGETQAIQRSRDAEEAALDASLENDVGRQIEAMPQRKREQLENELSRGVSAEAVRSTA